VPAERPVVGRCAAPAPPAGSTGPAMSRRTGAWLAAGAVAAGAFQVVVTVVPSPAPQAVWIITSSAIGLSFLTAGLAAWRRWPANRLGLLFSIVGYLWLAPHVRLPPHALSFTLRNALAWVYPAALAPLALAWPTGRLRSRFERWMVVTVYAWDLGQNVLSMLFWNPS